MGFWRWVKKGNKRPAEEEEKGERKGNMHLSEEDKKQRVEFGKSDEINCSVSPGYAKFGSGECGL